MYTAKRTLACLLGAAFSIAAAAAGAQMSLLPPACASLHGDALDKCVRDITVTQIEPKLEAVEPPPPDPAQTANCTYVLPADREYCIWRNELVLACRNKTKYPDFTACFTKYLPNIAKPAAVANCAREKASLQAACSARNTHYAKCLEDPLSYFLCLANKGKLPERLLKP